MAKCMLILISGPYLTGSSGDPQKVAMNLAAMEAMALPIFERCHLALVGEWLAWPVIRAAGGVSHNDSVFKAYQYPVALLAAYAFFTARSIKPGRAEIMKETTPE